MSYNTLWACRYQGENKLKVIDVHNILSVVAMPPFPALEGISFVGEKLGLDVAALGGIEQDLEDL